MKQTHTQTCQFNSNTCEQTGLSTKKHIKNIVTVNNATVTNHIKRGTFIISIYNLTWEHT